MSRHDKEIHLVQANIVKLLQTVTVDLIINLLSFNNTSLSKGKSVYCCCHRPHLQNMLV